MAFHDCDVEEADILEVQSVSDMFSAFKTPAADAVKLIGGDDITVFSPQLGLMVVTSQYDLEEPATTSQTVILSARGPIRPNIYRTSYSSAVGRPEQISARSSRPSPTRMPRPRHPSSITASVSPKAESARTSPIVMKRTCSI